MSKPIIVKPKNAYPQRFHCHAGDTFRELIDIWQEHGLVNVVETDETPYCWWGDVGNVLLYDRPTMRWYDNISYNLALFGNPKPPDTIQWTSPWIFWGRSPRKLYDASTRVSRSYNERNICSIFLGKIENDVQDRFRDTSVWSTCIDLFHCNKDYSTGTWKYTQDEYLDKLSHSKFGLCLRGFGPKCNREIELMAMGVVPIVTPGVDMSSYYIPPTENVHYMVANTPEDVKRIVNNTSEETWTKMSEACRSWYNETASPQGSFNVTKQIVERYRKPKSICTICTNGALHDLKVFLRTLRVHEPDIPLILLCDTITSNDVGELPFTHKIVCLDEYTNKNRKIMEQEGIFTDFVKLKTRCIDDALNMYTDTLYLDSDIVLLHSLPFVDTHKDIGLSPHGVKQYNCDKYGYYNSGYIYVNNKEFSAWWNKAIDTSKFFEQGALEDVPKHFSYFEIDFTNNFGWWRLLECDNPNERVRSFTTTDVILFEQKQVRSIHTHLTKDDFPLTVKFNSFIKTLANKCGTTYDYVFPTKNKVHILCQYYNDKNLERQREIDTCFRHNLANKNVASIVHFQEECTELPLWLKNHTKFHSTTCNERLTYKHAIDYANEFLKGELVCVCNADIFMYDQNDWSTLYSFFEENPKSVAALSRHEYDGKHVTKDPLLSRMNYANAQDAWIFVPVLTEIQDIDFPLGTLGCDNAFADRLKTAGYTPYNFANEYKIIHYDVCRGKRGDNATKFHLNTFQRKDAPEKRGQYLLPEYGAFNSLDNLAEKLKLDANEKYRFICDMFSYKFKIKNE